MEGHVTNTYCEPSERFTSHGKTNTVVFGDIFYIPNIYFMCFAKSNY